MAETNTSTPTKVVGAGKPVAAELPNTKPQAAPANTSPSPSTTTPATTTPAATPAVTPPANTPAATTPPANTPPANTPPAIDDASLKAYFESQGIQYEGIDKLRERLKPPTPVVELTDEQKQQAAIEKEKRIISQHLTRQGNTVEQFALFKNIISADKREVGFQREVEELVSLGASKEDAEKLANKRYFQYSEEDINALDEKDRPEAIKQMELGNKKLERKGAHLINVATEYMKELQAELAEQDAERALMEQHTSKVEDAVKKFVRQEKIAIGQVDDQNVDPIDFEYSDAAIASAKSELSDYKTFKEKLFTNDGEVNIDYILPILIRNFSMQEAAKGSYLAGGTRQVQKFEATFGHKPPPLGGRSNTASSGKISGYGAPQYGHPSKK